MGTKHNPIRVLLVGITATVLSIGLVLMVNGYFEAEEDKCWYQHNHMAGAFDFLFVAGLILVGLWGTQETKR